MKKTLIIFSIVTILASCGSNKKPSNEVANNKVDRSCTKTKSIGSNMPTINCSSASERKEQRKKSKETQTLGK